MPADTTLTSEQEEELSRVAAITDPIALVKEASRLIQECQNRIDKGPLDDAHPQPLRDLRSSACAYLLKPWIDVTLEYDPRLKALRQPREDEKAAAASRRQRAVASADKMLAAGRITAAEHRTRLKDASRAEETAIAKASERWQSTHGEAEATLLAARKAAMADVAYKPAEVYRDMLGVSRSTYTSWQSEGSMATLNAIRSNEDAVDVVTRAHALITNLASYEEALRGVRDPVLLRMFRGDVTHPDGTQIRNIEVAEWTGISKPGVTQLRRRWGVPDEEMSARNRMNRPDPTPPPPRQTRPRRLTGSIT